MGGGRETQKRGKGREGDRGGRLAAGWACLCWTEGGLGGEGWAGCGGGRRRERGLWSAAEGDFLMIYWSV